jgi:O-antigen/teichoic acid export membrane protein
MKRKFATSLVLMLVLNLLVKPFWIFGIDRTVQNIVGAGEYGLFFALFNFSLLLNILLDFGLTNFNNRDISRHSQLLPRYFSHMVVIKFLMAIAYLIISFSLALLLGYTGRQLWILVFLVLNQFLASFILYLRSNISGLQMFKTDSLLSVADRVLMIGLCAVLLWGPFRDSFKIEWFVYAQTISYIITAVIALTLVALQAGWVKPRYERAFLVSIFKQSYPYALLVLLMSFYYRIDTVMLERMLPDGDVQSGIYAQAFRLLDAANMVPYLFATLLLPMFSKMIKSDEPIQPLLGLAFSLLIVTAFSLGSAGIVYRDPIMDTLYVQHSAHSSEVFGLLMVSFVFISITYIFGTLLTAHGSLRPLNIISALGVVTNIVLNLVLIPRYMVVGAAYSSLITQGLMSILQVILVLKLFKFKVRSSHWFSFCFFIAGAIVFSIFSRFALSHWFSGFLLAIGCSVVLAFLVRLIKIEELFSLFLNRKSVNSTPQIE